jgi:hypothetical protein
MAREEEKRRGGDQEQIARREAISKARMAENEKVQRQQWSRSTTPVPKDTLQIPIPVKKLSTKSFEAEEEQRKRFLQDVEQATQVKGQQQQKSNIK